MPVYMIRAGETGPVKLGHSTDPIGRLAELQVAHYEKLSIIRTFVGDAAEEATLHLRFADLHIRGEWHAFSRLMLGDVGLREIPLTPALLKPKYGQLLETHATLLEYVEFYLTEHRMTATTFGVLAVNDGKFVSRLRSGVNMQTTTLSRAASFLKKVAA